MKQKETDFSLTNFTSGMLFTLAIFLLLLFLGARLGIFPNVNMDKNYYGLLVAIDIAIGIIICIREGPKLVTRKHSISK